MMNDVGRDLLHDCSRSQLLPVPATSGEQVHEHFTCVRDHKHSTGLSPAVGGLASVRCLHPPVASSCGTLMTTQTTMKILMRHWGDRHWVDISSLIMI